ncbi:hypothetical protein B0A48_00988 [Cryoendolithus antarcticus]|uniref:Uncharacterized protein n=1 Tax=Cryoendolithus antarcticus TaxID=1507870 RepID=A0A1V8TSD8_9PEZI|nr:hypothetical protein B0A48_00988 [Cryoendolithus antarcticus]
MADVDGGDDASEEEHGPSDEDSETAGSADTANVPLAEELSGARPVDNEEAVSAVDPTADPAVDESSSQPIQSRADIWATILSGNNQANEDTGSDGSNSGSRIDSARNS